MSVFAMATAVFVGLVTLQACEPAVTVGLALFFPDLVVLARFATRIRSVVFVITSAFVILLFPLAFPSVLHVHLVVLAVFVVFVGTVVCMFLFHVL